MDQGQLILASSLLNFLTSSSKMIGFADQFIMYFPDPVYISDIYELNSFHNNIILVVKNIYKINGSYKFYSPLFKLISTSLLLISLYIRNVTRTCKLR